ncbi:hypothetical protein HHI36_015578 [Cryptolaemus montrouzieri]|uniref:Uncharacterized protein n=1 Tax=Cryptolaemus montrouzieri TaxID=559131 RepID=A0ABD2N6E3_9CUCU
MSVIRTTLKRKGGRELIDVVNLHTEQINNLREFFSAKVLTSDLQKVVSLADKGYTPLNLATRDDLLNLTFLSDTEKQEQWSRKELHGRHHYEINQPHIDNEASNKWLMKGELFAETEGFLMANQDQVITRNNYKKIIMKDGTLQTDKCRKCHIRSETRQHITSDCEQLANTDYLHRHNHVCNIIHQKLAHKYGLLNTLKPYYKYQPAPVLENDSIRLY